MNLTLDIASEIYPLNQGENFTLAIARTLVPSELDEPEEEEGGVKKIKRELWRSGEQGIAADWEYVMYGKVGALWFERME
jgi:DNA-directed RNA polymerase I, II, and III subunit RPABC3